MKSGSFRVGYPEVKALEMKVARRDNTNPQEELLPEKRIGKGWHLRTRFSVGKGSSPLPPTFLGEDKKGKNRDLAANKIILSIILPIMGHTTHYTDCYNS